MFKSSLTRVSHLRKSIAVRTLALVAFGLLACCTKADAQCECGESHQSAVVESGNYRTVTGQSYIAPSFSQPHRGYESNSGIAQFTYYRTPVGSARGIPGQTVPVQTMVANFAPPTKLSGSRPTTARRTVFRQPLFRRW